MNDIGKSLRIQATSLRAQADRLDQLADQADEAGLRAGPVEITFHMDPEKCIRDALYDVPSLRQSELADGLGVGVTELRRHMRKLVADQKVGSIKGGDGQWVYSWVFREEGTDPTMRPRSSEDPARTREQSEAVAYVTPRRRNVSKPILDKRHAERGGKIKQGKR